MKSVSFLGSSLDELRGFPIGVRRMIGFQVERLQNGLEPNDWKPMKTVGAGVRELRVRDDSGAYRVIYVATFIDVVYVLHAFQKKSPATSKRDIELATSRFKELARGGTR